MCQLDINYKPHFLVSSDEEEQLQFTKWFSMKNLTLWFGKKMRCHNRLLVWFWHQIWIERALNLSRLKSTMLIRGTIVKKHSSWPLRYVIFVLLCSTYTQYCLISTTVNVLVLVVLIFPQNFSTNGPYVVLNFCKVSDTMVLFFAKKSYTSGFLIFWKISNSTST